MKVDKIKIKYLRRLVGGDEIEFWAEREVGQIIEDSAFGGVVDKVLEILVVSKEGYINEN